MSQNLGRVKGLLLSHGPEVYKAVKGSFKSGRRLKNPEVINMLANDICNSKCTMCNIWKQKLDFEITPTELEQILKDPLFKKVKRVGVTGGEPTMREDLAQLYEAACKSLPSLMSMSIITNAIKEKDVIHRISEVSEVLQFYKKNFSIMVSLDGYGAIHDEHRGRPGNFESALKVIEHFRNNTHIPVSIGCTITKGNVWAMDEMLDFLMERKLYGRFRLGEFIQRLYNDDLTDEIRNFSEDEVYHLLCFFERVIRIYEKNPKYVRTYRSIMSILQGQKRLIGCPYQGEGVVLDSRGEILYCAPKSKNLGNTLDTSAQEIYHSQVSELQRIKNEHCQDCVHDYHAPPTIQELLDAYRPTYWRMTMGIHTSNFTFPFILPQKQKVSHDPHILIAGWYGTETVGDKAILAGIIFGYREKYGNEVKFTIASIHPYVTRRTVKELDLNADIHVVPVYDRQFLEAASCATELVMGGGPLMDMESMAIPKMLVSLGKKYKIPSVIYGCGLGPLRKKKYIQVTKYILKNADVVKLRDCDSIQLAEKWTHRKDITFIGDPAKEYIHLLKNNQNHPTKKKPILACFLREWPKVYYKGNINIEEARNLIESKLAQDIKTLCNNFHLKPIFYSMHTFVVGGDDRYFYRRFAKKYFSQDEHEVVPYPSNVDSIVRAMSESSINLCMRFHSVLFAKELETNFLALDYTGGGKIKAMLKQEKMMDRYIDLNDYLTELKSPIIQKFS